MGHSHNPKMCVILFAQIYNILEVFIKNLNSTVSRNISTDPWVYSFQDEKHCFVKFLNHNGYIIYFHFMSSRPTMATNSHMLLFLLIWLLT